MECDSKHGLGIAAKRRDHQAGKAALLGNAACFSVYHRKSILHPKRRTVFRPILALIVKPSGGDIGMAQPFLHLGNIGIVLQSVGRRRRPQRMHAEAVNIPVDAHLLPIAPHDLLIDRSGVEGFSEGPGRVVLHRTKQRSRQIPTMPRRFQIGVWGAMEQKISLSP